MIIKVTGSINKFINKCTQNNIAVHNIKYYDQYIILNINEKDYEKVVKLNYYSQVTLIKYCGLKGYFLFFKKYLYDLLMLMLFILLIMLISKINVNVSINHESEKLRVKVKEILNEYNITSLSISKDLKELNRISDDILKNNRNFLEWISINKEGMRYKVNFEERIETKKIKEDSMCNIIATKDATIKNIITQSGEEIVIRDQVVKKGDVLISGLLYLNDKLKSIVCAKGEVLGEVWYKVHITVPYLYQEKVLTDNSRINLYFNGNYLYKKNYDYYDTKTIYSKKIFNNIFKIERESEYKIISKKYSYDEAKKVALSRAKTEVLKKLDNKSKIIDEKVLKEIKNNSTIELDIFISTLENIGESVLINKEDLQIEE